MSKQPENTKTADGGAATTAEPKAPTEAESKRLREFAAELIGHGFHRRACRPSDAPFLKLSAAQRADPAFVRTALGKSGAVAIDTKQLTTGFDVSLSNKADPLPVAASIVYKRTTSHDVTTAGAGVELATATYVGPPIAVDNVVPVDVVTPASGKTVDDLIEQMGTCVVTRVIVGGLATVIERKYVQTDNTTVSVTGPNGTATAAVGWSKSATTTALRVFTRGGVVIDNAKDLAKWGNSVDAARHHVFVAGIAPLFKFLPEGSALRAGAEAHYNRELAELKREQEQDEAITAQFHGLLKRFKDSGKVTFYDFVETKTAATATAAATTARVRFVVGIDVVRKVKDDELWELRSDAPEPPTKPLLTGTVDKTSTIAFDAHIRDEVTKRKLRLLRGDVSLASS